MKRLVLLILVLSACPLWAGKHKDDQPALSAADTVDAFAVRPPDENSPFFLDTEVAKKTTGTKFVDRGADNLPVYPRNKDSVDTAGAMFTNFFTKMFASVNLSAFRQKRPEDSKILVEPAAFSLSDRHEINVTYSVYNNTKNLMRLEYPTTQHIEILTYDRQGNVIDRWSKDHTFNSTDGIVIVNPKERIEYQERIPTHEMKPGEPYRIEAKTTTTPVFPASQSITPK